MPSPSLTHLAPRMRAVLREAKAGLAARYRERLKAVLLYGSWARGTAGPESDVDLLVVLDRMRSACAEVDSIVEAVAPVGLRHDLYISGHPVEWERFRNGPRDPFLENVKGEGVAL